MKVKLLLILFACIHQFNYSQTNRFLKGKVMSDNFPLQKVDVINKTTHASTSTDVNGAFVLAAKVNDSILFYNKNYELKGIKLSPDDIKNGTITVELTKKAEELEEVVIKSVSIGPILPDQKTTNEIELEKKKNSLQRYISGYNDGTIPNGIDFVKIGKMLFGGIFKGGKKSKPEIEFKEVASSKFDQKFYSKILQLKEKEIEAFLVFCNFDPESKKMLSENSNELILMDFLHKKSIEFKKINASE